MTYRNVVLALLGVQAVGMILITIGLVAFQSPLPVVVGTAIVALIYTGLLVAYWYGWEAARYATIVLATLSTVIVLPEPFLTREVSFMLFAAPVQALILTNSAWVVGSAVATYAGMLIKAGGQGVYTDPVTIIIYAILVGGMALSRLLTETAQRAAESNARIAGENVQRAEQQARELARKADELSRTSTELMQRNEEQQRLLDLVATLETPVVSLASGVLLAPLVGHMDSRRAQKLTASLLQTVADRRATMVVIDIAGVSMVDTAVALALIQTAQALRLLGCQVCITGISASVAMTLIHLDIDLQDVSTARSPQEVLMKYYAPASDREQAAKHGTKHAAPENGVKHAAPENGVKNGSGNVSKNGHQKVSFNLN